jgi:hypothetical protein
MIWNRFTVSISEGFGMLPRRALRSAAQAGRRGAPRLEAGKLGSSIECR